MTVGAALPSNESDRASLIDVLGGFALAGREALQRAGLAVQTTRLSTQPLEEWLTPGPGAASLVAALGKVCSGSGFEYCALGTVQAAIGPDNHLGPLLDSLVDLLLAADNVFGSVQVAMRNAAPVGSTVSIEAVRAAARTIRLLSEQTEGGFGNLRFAASANCPPHIPFFPASYYAPSELNAGRPEFALALEAADVAVRAFQGAQSLDEARGNLLAMLVDEGGRAAEACAALAAEHGYAFSGLDISMAPYPEPDRSIGRALEILSGAPLGSPGTLAAAAFFTSVLREARDHLPTVGYSGLMLPALEDQTLADATAAGLVTVDTLLLLSAVCGLGLDTVPLPGDATLSQLERVILDMAALAVRLDKPLTARLLPVPGRSAGEPAEWPHFPYFAKGRVMALAPVEGGKGLLLNGPLSLA